MAKPRGDYALPAKEPAKVAVITNKYSLRHKAAAKRGTKGIVNGAL